MRNEMSVRQGRANQEFMLRELSERLKIGKQTGLTYINVRDQEFGAYGDYSHDDTRAFQKALATGRPLFVPEGFYLANVTLPSRAVIIGSGWNTIIKGKSPSRANVFSLEDENAYGIYLQGFKMEGGQDAAIHFDNTGGKFQYCDDPLHILRDIYIYRPDNDGIYFGAAGTATQGCIVDNVYVWKAGRYGFNLNGGDNRYINCHAGHSTSHGWYVSEGSSSFLACMGYGSGGDGMRILAGATSAQVVGYHGQENTGNGLTIYGGGGHCLAGCVLDYNANGLVLDGNTQYNTIGNTKCSENTTYELSVTSGSGFNKGQIMVGTITKVNLAEASNALDINNQDGYQAVAYASTITPEPYYGSRVYVLLTDNITVNVPTAKHSGMRMTFYFLQDGTGGRTITFDAAYKTVWTASKTADKYDVITFFYDGTNWIETSSAVGVG